MPVADKLFSSTLPVDSVQDGGVMVPTTGISGFDGCELIINISDATDAHPTELITVNV